MNQEWPVGPPAAADDAEPLLPLVLEDHVALIKASAAVDAIARKRAVQIVSHGHTLEADLARPPGLLACEAKARLNAFTEIAGGRDGRMTLTPQQRERCLRYVEIVGGIVISLWERCQAEVPES
jgi:hypothetical protein